MASSGDSCNKSASAKTASSCSKDASAASYAENLKKIVDEAPFREGKKIVLTGNMECGKCTYSMASCAPMIKTTDGKIYPLAKSDKVSDMRTMKAENGFKVSAKVVKVDGIKFLDVTNVESL